jgi:hypothetical protein
MSPLVGPAGPPGHGRRVAVYLLLLVAGLLLFVSACAVWVNRLALNTDQFADTSSELIADRTIREAIAVRAVDELYDNVDVKAELEKQLPKDLQRAAGVAAAAGREGAYWVAERALRQQALQRVWRATVRQAHAELVAVLEGGGTTVSTQEGVVNLDLRPIVLDTAERLGIRETVEDQLPADVAQVQILRSDELDAAQTVFQLLKTLAWFLPVLMILLLGLAVLVARGRRRETVRNAGVVVAAAAVVGLVAVTMTGSYIVDALATDTDTRAAADDAWGIVTKLLRSALWWQIVVGVLVVLATWLAGPSRYALTGRQLAAPVLRERLYPYAALAIVGLVLLVSAPVQDFARLLFVAVIVGVLAAGIEVLRRQTLHEFPEGAAGFSIVEARTKVTSWIEAQRTGRAVAQRPAGADLATRLQTLAELHASGALTDEEFATAKARVLAGE